MTTGSSCNQVFESTKHSCAKPRLNSCRDIRNSLSYVISEVTGSGLMPPLLAQKEYNNHIRIKILLIQFFFDTDITFLRTEILSVL